MRKLTAILLCSLISFNVYASAKPAEVEVNQVLDAFHAAASAADGERYFNLMSQDAIFIGTDATETWTISEFKAFAEPYFSIGTGWTYHPRDRQVQFSKDKSVAWFVELLDQAKYGECRGTGVLELTGDGWKIKQYHLTIPIPNDLAGDMTKQIKAFQGK